MRDFTSLDGHTLRRGCSSVRYGPHLRRARRSMNNNNNGSRGPVFFLPLALSALVSACQSVGPEQVAPAAPLAVIAAVPAPLEPIVLPSLEYRELVVEPDLFVRLRSRFTLEISQDPVVQRERDWYARNQN